MIAHHSAICNDVLGAEVHVARQHSSLANRLSVITDFTDAATTLTFTSGTGTLVGKDTFVVNFTEDVINNTMLDMLMYNLTDASAISIAVSGGGATGHLWVEYEYWSET